MNHDEWKGYFQGYRNGTIDKGLGFSLRTRAHEVIPGYALGYREAQLGLPARVCVVREVA